MYVCVYICCLGNNGISLYIGRKRAAREKEREEERWRGRDGGREMSEKGRVKLEITGQQKIKVI